MASETRWGGVAPKVWSRQRCEQVRAVSRWKRAVKDGAMPSVYDCMLRERFVKLVAEGTCYPYPLVERANVRRVRVPDAARAAWRLRERHRIALGLVVAAHLSCKTAGLIITHAEMGEVLSRYLGTCSAKWAGVTMRQLAEMGLLEITPWFSGGVCNLRQASLYRVSAFAVQFFDIKPRRARAKASASRDEQPFQSERSPIKIGETDRVESPGEDAGDVVPEGRAPAVPDATADDNRTAKGVKNRPEAPPAPTERVSTNGPVRASARLDVEAHVQRIVEKQHAQLRSLAGQLAAAQRKLEARTRELDVAPPAAGPPAPADTWRARALGLDERDPNALLALGLIDEAECLRRLRGRS